MKQAGHPEPGQIYNAVIPGPAKNRTAIMGAQGGVTGFARKADIPVFQVQTRSLRNVLGAACPDAIERTCIALIKDQSTIDHLYDGCLEWSGRRGQQGGNRDLFKMARHLIWLSMTQNGPVACKDQALGCGFLPVPFQPHIAMFIRPEGNAFGGKRNHPARVQPSRYRRHQRASQHTHRITKLIAGAENGGNCLPFDLKPVFLRHIAHMGERICTGLCGRHHERIDALKYPPVTDFPQNLQGLRNQRLQQPPGFRAGEGGSRDVKPALRAQGMPKAANPAHSGAVIPRQNPGQQGGKRRGTGNGKVEMLTHNSYFAPTDLRTASMRPITLQCPCCTFCRIRSIEAALIFTDGLRCTRPMIFWILATTVMLIALFTLYYAGRGDAVNALGNSDATREHFKAQLAEIESDTANGRMTESEAAAAKGELAREVLRLQAEAGGKPVRPLKQPKSLLVLVLLVVGGGTLAVYTTIGAPGLPAQPLEARAIPTAAPSVDVPQAIAAVEAQLAANPDDARGWSVLGPIYMQSERYADAVTAFRRVLELLPVTADAETDLAEALMMANNGAATGEPMQLLQSAAARDPQHIRSRFYLAGEATRAGDYEDAIAQWQALLALGTGSEPWVETARRGIAVAEAGLTGEAPPEAPVVTAPDPDQQQMIEGMVEGLSARLEAEGGSIEEWTRLVRSRLVLGDIPAAQAAYDAARLAYPDAALRTELDAMAQNAGLE